MKFKSGIPNFITSLNLISGIVSIIFSFYGEFDLALLCIVFSAIFDFFDGFSARLLGAYSDIGKELDSLSDLVSFGLAPSLLLYNYMVTNVCGNSWSIPALITLYYAVQAAFRLAKFNVDDSQTHTFIGLPTPAAAGFLGSMILVALHNNVFALAINNPYYLPIAAIIIAELTISKVPMFSLKLTSFKWAENKNLYSYVIHLVIVVIILFALGLHWSIPILYLFTSYICWNIITNIIYLLKKINK
ncbi:MAG: CDP-diacylglycerol--serine O-phosphatidyltransferase [Bacteroidales bacterium]